MLFFFLPFLISIFLGLHNEHVKQAHSVSAGRVDQFKLKLNCDCTIRFIQSILLKWFLIFWLCNPCAKEKSKLCTQHHILTRHDDKNIKLEQQIRFLFICNFKWWNISIFNVGFYFIKFDFLLKLNFIYIKFVTKIFLFLI